MSEDEASASWGIGVEDVIDESGGGDGSIGSSQGDWRELCAFRQEGIQDAAFMVLGGLDQELMNFREVSL